MVNVNPAYRAHELEYVLQQSGISLLVASLAHKSSDYRAIVEQVRGRCPALRETVYIGDPSWDALTAGAAAVEQDRVDALAAELSCDDPVNIQYTSGTTGFPRAPPSPTTTSSTTATGWAARSATRSRTGSVCRCPFITALAW